MNSILKFLRNYRIKTKYPIIDKSISNHLEIIENWLRSYRPQELFNSDENVLELFTKNRFMGIS